MYSDQKNKVAQPISTHHDTLAAESFEEKTDIKISKRNSNDQSTCRVNHGELADLHEKKEARSVSKNFPG